MATPTQTVGGTGAPSLRGAWALLRQVAKAWVDDRAPSAGAALSYYTLFSLAPLLLIAISVAGLLFGPEAARGEIFGQLTGLVGPAGALAVQELLDNVNRPADGLWATALGGVLMLVGATTVFAELQDALDRIWRAPNPPRQGLWALLRARVLSFGLVLGLGFLLVVSMLFSAAVAALQAWWTPEQAPLSLWHASLLGAFNQLVSLLLMALLFAMIYKVMPRARIAWADVWVGAVVTALLMAAGRWLIGLYLQTSAIGSGFGAAGALVAVLVWVYYAAQIFLLGAEFTWVYAYRCGSRRGEAPPPSRAG